MKRELVKLYKEYCEYIDAEDMPENLPEYMRNIDMNSYYKTSFQMFLYWLEHGDKFTPSLVLKDIED